MENAATFDNQVTAGVPSAGTIRQMGEGAAEAGRQLWLAGLGLVALAGKAVRESGHAFEVLVEEGRELEPKLTSGVKKSWTGVSSTVESVGSKVTSLGRRGEGEESESEAGWVEDKVKSYLERFGVATREDIQQVVSRLESIESQLLEKARTPGAAAEAVGETAGTEAEEPEHGGRSKRHPRH